VLAACGGSDETTNATPEVTAELTQSRLDQSIGNVSVSIANDGDTPVHVHDLILHAPPFPDAASDNDGVILHRDQGRPGHPDPARPPVRDVARPLRYFGTAWNRDTGWAGPEG
jgi:hypothetical protein